MFMRTMATLGAVCVIPTCVQSDIGIVNVIWAVPVGIAVGYAVGWYGVMRGRHLIDDFKCK